MAHLLLSRFYLFPTWAEKHEEGSHEPQKTACFVNEILKHNPSDILIKSQKRKTRHYDLQYA